MREYVQEEVGKSIATTLKRLRENLLENEVTTKVKAKRYEHHTERLSGRSLPKESEHVHR